MKKITLGALTVLLGFFVFHAPVLAATTANATLDTEDAVIAKQSLDVLQAVLNQVRAKIDAQDGVVNNATEISAALNGITAKLQDMHGTLASIGGGSALADNMPAELMGGPTTVIAPTPTMGELTPTVSANDETAAVASHFSAGKFVWPSVVAIVIFLSVWLLRFKSEDEELALAEFPPVKDFPGPTARDFPVTKHEVKFDSKNETRVDSRKTQVASWD
jgi:hypothetical protein